MNTRTDAVEIDLQLVESLTKREIAALDEKHVRSLAYREEAKTHLPGGVSSSWQTWPPHPIYVSRGKGSRIWDIDGNEYVDYALARLGRVPFVRPFWPAHPCSAYHLYRRRIPSPDRRRLAD